MSDHEATNGSRWRNWQTRWLQEPVSARTYGFKSLPRYQEQRQGRNTCAQVAELVYAYV